MNEEKREQYDILKDCLAKVCSLSLDIQERLAEKMLNHPIEFNANPIETLITCLNEISKEIEFELNLPSEKNNISSTTEFQDNGIARTNHDERRIERGKSFVESMSFQGKELQETIQKRRDERYEQMISEAKEIESPINRLHH